MSPIKELVSAEKKVGDTTVKITRAQSPLSISPHREESEEKKPQFYGLDESEIQLQSETRSDGGIQFIDV